MEFTIVDDGRETQVDASIRDGRVLLGAAALQSATGWSVQPRGLCHGETCVPLSPSSSVMVGNEVDLEAFADYLGRPAAIDLDAKAASLGDSAAERSRLMRGGLAPDFTLPDLAGHLHSLGDFRGRKTLLVAWASW